MEQFVLVITEINKTDKYQIGKDTQKFETLDALKQWVKTESTGHKLNKMYRDNTDGTSYQVGYVWCYWDQYSDNKGKFLHEIWLEVLKETIEPVKLD